MLVAKGTWYVKLRRSAQWNHEKRSEDRILSRMSGANGVRNTYGTVRAGAMVWLADVTATVLAIGQAEVGEDAKGFPLAVGLHTTLMGNQSAGEILAKATVVRRGRMGP